MIIEVKQKHIEAGKRHCATRCAVALAVQETGASDHVSVTQDFPHSPYVLHLLEGDVFDIYDLPEVAQTWIAAFDASESCQPITFEAELRVEEPPRW